jgi:hypothetical protein
MNNLFQLFVPLTIVSVLSGCQNLSAENSPAFSEAEQTVIAFDTKARRKWDNALICDFDQDGYLDMLITEHGKAAMIYWNNKGLYSKPVTVIKGDTHGAAAADYDGDGDIELIISQGGGGGNNPRLPVLFNIDKKRNITGGKTFDHFERSRGRAVKLIDSDNNGKLDLLLSAFPLKSQKLGANHLYKNDSEGTFEFVNHLPQAQWLGYRVLVTDFDNNMDQDVIFYGGKNMIAVRGEEGFGYSDVSKSVFANLANISNVSSITEIDFDNDGDQDLLLARAKHQFEHQSFYDEQLKTFAFFGRFKPFEFEDLIIDGNLILENLQMAYPSYDVFIGEHKTKLKTPKDRGGERELIITSSEAKGWPKNRKDKGLYVGYLGDNKWRITVDTKSPTAAVVHNVIVKPKTIEQEELPVYLLENQQGKFVDVTKVQGINIPYQTTSATAGDFNNDGWQDLLILPYGSMAKTAHPLLLENQQGKGFTLIEKHGLSSTKIGVTGGSIENFDYDKDGDLDIIYTHERGNWHLFNNNTNNPLKSAVQSKNNFIAINVGHAITGDASAMGAKVSVSACGQEYIRNIGSTSSAFSHSLNNLAHVGIGTCNSVEKVVVTWSNLESSSIQNPQINTVVNVGN